ncbi:dihydroorotate dehydrogenase [bacterium]|nr:dihydroorotate dehydrogenase [bacterium]
MRPLEISIAGLQFKNPVIIASGTCGYGLEYAPYLDLNRPGGIVVKGISMEPQPGNPPPRIIETPSGMLNAIGLQNIGCDKFVTEYLPKLRDYDPHIIVNIHGRNIDEYKETARKLSEHPGISALEINISCPNVRQGGLAFGTDPLDTDKVVSAVRKETNLPLITKLSPNVTDICPIARAAEEAGSDAISLINTLLGMKVDITTRHPMLANVTGGLSGPAIRPVALRMVWQTVKTVNIPVIGIGGIMTCEDALEFLIVGASAVQVGTAMFVDPQTPVNIIDGLDAFLKDNGMENIGQIIGSLNLNLNNLENTY